MKKKLKIFLKKVLGVKEYPSYYTHGIHKRINIVTNKSFNNFSKAANKAIKEKKTFLYFDRLFTIYNAARSMPVRSNAVEVGAKKGGTTKFIDSITHPKCKIYCCDTFEGHVQIDKIKDGSVKLGDHGNIKFEQVKKYLKNRKNIKIIKGDILKTYQKIKLQNIGLVHLDVDVFIPTKFVLNKFFPAVKKGCIIIIDDYLNNNTPGVKLAVDQFVFNKKNKIRLYFSILLTGQAVIVKIK